MNDTLALNGVLVQHHFSDGGVYIKETRIPAGIRLEQHMHPHDHLSVLVSGEAWVVVDDEPTLHHSGAIINIQAGKYHSVVAVSDVVWLCVHATDDKNPTTVDTSILKGE